MPSVLPFQSLQTSLVHHFVKNMDSYIRDYYGGRMHEISLANRPTFGYFRNAPYGVLHQIIKELIKREILPLKYLKVLLPENETTLFCNEDVEFTPFKPDLLELILRRCQNLETLHFHHYDDLIARISSYNVIINDSIPSLEQLREINFYDSRIEDETLKIIAQNCRFLDFLNIRRTEVTDNGIEYLINDFSLVKNTLITLIMDSIDVSLLTVVRCLIRLQNLNYFISDTTFVAGALILEAREDFVSTYGQPFISGTTILKHRFEFCKIFKPSNQILTWFLKTFENVMHLVLTGIKKTDMLFVKSIIPLMNITYLELSAEANPRYLYSFRYLRKAVASCGPNLISLKLENFNEVDVFYLGKKCKKLQELFLINNLYNFIDPCQVPNLFEELVEVQIILIRQAVTYYDRQLNLTPNALFSILSSSKIKKILVCCQVYFSDSLLGDLIEYGHLKNLKELYIYHCDQISDLTIYDFISSFEPIKKLEVGFLSYLSEDMVNMMCGFITMKRLDISLTRVTELPYCLRWSVVNIPVNKRDKFDADSEYLFLDKLFIDKLLLDT